VQCTNQYGTSKHYGSQLPHLISHQGNSRNAEEKKPGINIPSKGTSELDSY